MSFVTSIINKFRSKPTFCSAIIAAAGFSSRMGGDDKLLLDINGKPVLVHALAAFQNSGSINEIIIVSTPDKFEHIGMLCRHYGIDKAIRIMAGGRTRAESVLNGILAVSKGAQVIAIHDGARPCVDDGVIARAISAVSKHHAVAPAVPVSSTLKRAENRTVVETVDRNDLFEIQTPQVFTVDIIKAALQSAVDRSVDITDDCMAVELMGIPVYLSEGSRSNIKVTTSEDIVFAEVILRKHKEEADQVLKIV